MERATAYLADDAEICELLEAQGCKQEFHSIRTDELGLGPVSGSYFLLTVQAGEIVQALKSWGIEKFSRQMWEPFANWVYERHPKDVAVMCGGSRAQLESVGLWEKRSREHVKAEIAKIAPWLNIQLNPGG